MQFEYFFMQTCERIKSERKRLGYSQTEFADIAHATRGTVSNWESGVGSPDVVALGALANVGLDVLYVVTGDRSFEPPKKLTSEEETMLEYFSQADKEARKAALRALLVAASSVAGRAAKEAAPPGSRIQTISAPVSGVVAGGRVVIKNNK
nr:helix-turn-helix transcriptional regulator [Rhodoferax sp.]